MKYVFIQEHRGYFAVKKMAETLKVSRGGYYQWVKQGFKTRRQFEGEYYTGLMKLEFERSRRTYGSRRLTRQISKVYGIRIGRRRVEELMRENNLVPKTVRKFKATTNSNHNYPASPNLLSRNFKMARVNQAWETTPYVMQQFLYRGQFSADELRNELRGYVSEKLGDEDGVLVVDETGFLKQGKMSCGVKRQYSGTAGRIENCQIGVFLTYASEKGHALIDRRLYIPEDWFTDPKRCRKAGIPETVGF